ncbi:MAG: ParB N-terminal domain-containing protein [Acidovorax temperans]|uniref:ParB N-terminal domain-containing protein n=1 Tax=Acidovorax temperans TaxID=80878 RepID=UPI00391AFDDB
MAKKELVSKAKDAELQQLSPVQMLDIDQLVLDAANPRLPEAVERDEPSMMAFIAESTAIEDLMQAIGQNGFFEGEPVVAILEKNKFVVVEGNRRLTAVRLLNNPHTIAKPSARIVGIANDAKHKPKSIPVIVRKTREEVLPYLGFRHITGVKQWEPLAKARYIEQIFQTTDKSISPEARYAQVAKTIGSRKDHIHRNLDALAVYRQIKESDFYNIPDLSERSIRFAVLSTAVADERIGIYVGVAKEAEGDEQEFEDSFPTNPIINPKALNKNHIKELAEWLYKTNDKGETRVGESRNLRQLSAVVSTPKALEAFKSGSTLSYAYRLTKGAGEELKELLYEAENILTRAVGFVANVEYEEESYELAKQLREKVILIGKTLKDKQTSSDDF